MPTQMRLPAINTIALLFVHLSTGYGQVSEATLREAEQWHRNHQQASEGISIGEIRKDVRSFGSAGHMRAEGNSVDENTLYEIGSITKVFTGVLLADTVSRGLANLDDSIAKHLPSGLLSKDSPLNDVTLLELSTHTSGLPRLPADLGIGGDPSNPYAHYSRERLFSYLSTFSESDFSERGSYSYSNLAVGLLGEILGIINNTDFAQLLTERILEPLKMDSTWVQVDETSQPKTLKRRFAVGHQGGEAVPYWRLNALSGAGAMVSSVNDLLNFAEAHWSDDTPNDLREALTLAMTPHSEKSGLGWEFSENGELSHEGGTGGFRTLLTIQPAAKYAKVSLRNSSGEAVVVERRGDFSQLAGYWSGSLNLGKKSLRAVIRITNDGEARFYSIDQGAAPIPSSKATFKNDELILSFPMVSGTYRAKFDTGTLIGTWSQGSPKELNLEYSANMPSMLSKIFDRIYSGPLDRLTGYWQGTLGNAKYGLIVYLQVTPIDGGRHEVSILSPTQTPLPIPVSKVELSGDQLLVEAKMIQGTFSGTIDSESKRLEGVWNQRGDRPITLTRTATPPELNN